MTSAEHIGSADARSAPAAPLVTAPAVTAPAVTAPAVIQLRTRNTFGGVLFSGFGAAELCEAVYGREILPVGHLAEK